MKPLLTDRVAIINGGATGMGRATALLFAEEGCNCVIADIKEEEGRQTAAEATQRGREAIFVKCDLADLKQIKDCVDKTIEKFGKVEILVGCAGASRPPERAASGHKPAERRKTGIRYTDERYYDLMMSFNLKGHVFFCKEVSGYMIDQRYGKICIISTIGVYHPPGPAVEYHAAKAGLIGLVNNLAYELAAYKINVNGILPGPVKSPFWDPVLSSMPEDKRDALMEGVGSVTPLGRTGVPEDIANTVLFLCSEMSSYITGQMINVSGGLPMERCKPGGMTQRVQDLGPSG
jgi:3-oxoacyl-[acyl-carrier protein] reductase